MGPPPGTNPSFPVCRKYASFSLRDLPNVESVPKGRFKELLIREGRLTETKGGAVKKYQCSPQAKAWFLLKEYAEQNVDIFEFFCRNKGPRFLEPPTIYSKPPASEGIPFQECV